MGLCPVSEMHGDLRRPAGKAGSVRGGFSFTVLHTVAFLHTIEVMAVSKKFYCLDGYDENRWPEENMLNQNLSDG